MTSPLPESTSRHLERVRDFYDAAPTEVRWGARSYRALLAHYYNLLIPTDATVLEIGCGSGDLLSRLKATRKTGIDLSPRQIEAARQRVPGAKFHVHAGELIELPERFDVIIISDTLNLASDVQLLLERLQHSAHPGTRLIINFQNSLWRPALTLARWLGLKAPQPENSWLASSDVLNLLQLAGWNQIWHQGRLLLPIDVPCLTPVLNRGLAPFLQWFCLTVFIVARPIRSAVQPCTVSVVIPARNEAGNIEAAVRRTAELGAGTELIFVEGHSRDDTWEQIQWVARENPERKIKIMQQTGKGKG
ncbi:MAG: methyltransferase domain-containing protein, partial [Bryocella sp.]